MFPFMNYDLVICKLSTNEFEKIVLAEVQNLRKFQLFSLYHFLQKQNIFHKCNKYLPMFVLLLFLKRKIIHFFIYIISSSAFNKFASRVSKSKIIYSFFNGLALKIYFGSYYWDHGRV